MRTLHLPRALLTGVRLAEEARFAEALQSLDRVDFDRAYPRRDDRVHAEALVAAYRGLALCGLERYEDALPALLHAERDVVWPAQRAFVLRQLGYVALQQWRPEDGLRYSADAIDLIEAQPRRTPAFAMDLVNALLDQAACVFMLGRTDEALAANDRAYAVLRTDVTLADGANRMLTALCLANRAVHLELADRWAEAVTAARMAMVVGWRVREPSIVLKVLCAEAVLGSALSRLGRREEALEIRLRLVDPSKAYAESHGRPDFLADVLLDVAEGLTECGRADEAWRYLDSALGILDQHCAEMSDVAMLRAGERGVRALLLEAVGERDTALASVEQCLVLGHGALQPGRRLPRFLREAGEQRDRLAARG